VIASDGVSLAVYEHGSGAGGTNGEVTVLAVHGYPDDHTVWDGVVAELARRYRVVSYDVRGAGASGEPRNREGYRIEQLTADLAAVADAVSPGRPVHLLGHDWGSIQCWHAVTDSRLASRFASFTSISGPSLDHVRHWMRSRVARPTPRRLGQLTRQAASSGYIGLFQLPVLPETLWRSRFMTRLMRMISRGDTGIVTPQVGDAVRGLEMYRANMLGRLASGRSGSTDGTAVPVQVLVPTKDAYVTPALQSDVADWSAQPYLRRIPTGHWLPRSHPQVVARCAGELIDHVSGADTTNPTLRRAAARATAEHSGRRNQGSVVVVTGAGSGIGRATALAFAERGADVVIADLNAHAAEETRWLAAASGVRAVAHQVDVSDRAGMEAFAKKVTSEFGVPDIVVNNAGIGMAGAFLQTSEDDWRRVIDVNLWGVIHGCRVFGELMVRHGEGGTLVNIASAAAYVPSRGLPAYATTKAAVLMLSECLRGEFADYGIGVQAICPGLINTNITATTRFVGEDNTEERRRQQAASAAYDRRNYSPERVAREILDAVDHNRAVTPVTPEARIGLVASRLTPSLLRAAARREINI
jgi:NAD(P)-dependent dehydrogenase (short-subunit alcohol dehydrogenase family)/pimeloyl-ACP methyl ester carboxylesterase